MLILKEKFICHRLLKSYHSCYWVNPLTACNLAE
jgi:hypothetical protein